MNWLKVPKKVYFKRGSMPVALKELSEVYDLKKAFIISDADLYKKGVVRPVDDWVRGKGLRTAEFFTIDPVPTFENVRSGMQKMTEFQPDVIIGVGGGAVMSTAKVMHLAFEDPQVDLSEIADKFYSTDSGKALFPAEGNKAKLVLVATTSGTGAECSPFAVLADDKGKKRVFASYEFLPEIAVIDADFSDSMPEDVAKAAGLKVLNQAVRAFMSPDASDYTKGFAIEAARLVLENLPEFVSKGAKAPKAGENMAHAAALAGMAAGNALRTIDPDAPVYPEGAAKTSDDMDKDELDPILDLARHVGLNGKSKAQLYGNWIAACEVLTDL